MSSSIIWTNDARDNGMIRRYKAGDHLAIGRIFHDAVHQIACRDYTQEQLDAWASPPADVGQWEEDWKQRCERKIPFVKEIGGAVVGFIELDPDGHIDCTYVDPAHAGTGVMREIMAEVKREAKLRGNERLFAEVSKTGRRFFERNGFTWVRDNLVERRGVTLVNYIMECRLAGQQSRPA